MMPLRRMFLPKHESRAYTCGTVNALKWPQADNTWDFIEYLKVVKLHSCHSPEYHLEFEALVWNTNESP